MKKLIFILLLLPLFCKAQPSSFKDSLQVLFGIRFGSVINTDDIKESAPRPANYLDNQIFPYINHVFIPAGWNRVEFKNQIEFSWQKVDSIADAAVAHNAIIKIHSLVWNSDIPAWLRDGNFTAAEKKQILINHIDSVVNHFKNKYPSIPKTYAVVNEPLCDKANTGEVCFHSGIDNGFWSNVHKVGSTDSTDWIQIAFEETHLVDPSAKLYLSEIGTERASAKSNLLYSVIKHLLLKKTPIDGVAYETHLNGITFSQPPEKFTNELNRYTALGLMVQITELDCRLTDYLDTSLQLQAKAYAIIVDGYLHADSAHRNLINLWGLWDSTQGNVSTKRGGILADDFSTKPNWNIIRSTVAHFDRKVPLTYPLYLTWNRSKPGNLNVDGTWTMYNAGDVSQSFNFPNTGNYKFILSAYGIKFSGIYPQLQVKIDNVVKDILIISSASQYIVTHNIIAGNHKIAFNLINSQSASRLAILTSLSIDTVK